MKFKNSLKKVWRKNNFAFKNLIVTGKTYVQFSIDFSGRVIDGGIRFISEKIENLKKTRAYHFKNVTCPPSPIRAFHKLILKYHVQQVSAVYLISLFACASDRELRPLKVLFFSLFQKHVYAVWNWFFGRVIDVCGEIQKFIKESLKKKQFCF